MVTLTFVTIAGMVMTYALPYQTRHAKLACFCLAMAFATNMPLGLSMVILSVGGFSRKATVNVMVHMAYCIGSIVRPQFYLTAEALTRRTGFKASVGQVLIGAVLLICLGASSMWENKWRDGRAAARSLSTPGQLGTEIMGHVKDWQNMKFRYLQ